MPFTVWKITPEFALPMRLFMHFGDTSDSRALLSKVSVCTCSQRSYAPLCLIQISDLATGLRKVGLCCSLADLQQQGEKGCNSHGLMEMGRKRCMKEQGKEVPRAKEVEAKKEHVQELGEEG